MMKRIFIAMGTRPEAVKLCPVINELRKSGSFDVTVCNSGQHREMMKGTPEAFGVRPDLNLGVLREGQTLSTLFSDTLSALDRVLRETEPELVMVQGDTTTACAAALAAFYRGIPVAHVEAGLRTYHLHSPFPEELHRESISMIAAYHFAPTPTAKRNLLREGKPESNVFLTGNTVVDALHFTLAQKIADEWSFPPHVRPILFTAHRRENLGKPMEEMFRSLRKIVEMHPDVVAICPLHRNPKVRFAAEAIKDCDRIRIIDPPDVVHFHHLLARCFLVMTDSGGIQEETTALGIPTVVMRFSTERAEGIRAGCLRLAGSREGGIVDAVNRLLEPDSELYAAMHKPSAVFGDGKASARIVRILTQTLS